MSEQPPDTVEVYVDGWYVGLWVSHNQAFIYKATRGVFHNLKTHPTADSLFKVLDPIIELWNTQDGYSDLSISEFIKLMADVD